MSADIVNISTSIVAKLQGVSGIVAVYAYEPDKPTNGGYPFATVTPQAFSGEFGDTIRNLRTYTYVVRVYQERTETAFGNEKAERLAREMVDEILTAFDADTTLSGRVKWVKPARGSLDYADREIGDTRIIEIELECMNVVPSTT